MTACEKVRAGTSNRGRLCLLTGRLFGSVDLVAEMNSRRRFSRISLPSSGAGWDRPALVMFANWLLQFSLFIAIIFFLGADAPIGRVSLGLSPERIVELYGFSDAGSYLQAGLDLELNNANTAGWAWVLNLWPPGMVWLNALVLRFSVLDFGVTLGILSALVWSVPFALITRRFMRSWLRVATVAAIELAILGTSPFQSWMLDEGLLYADGLAAAFFLTGIVLLSGWATEKTGWQAWTRDGLFAGAAIAGAVYFRASYQLVPVMVILLLVVVSIRLVLTHRRSRVKSTPSDSDYYARRAFVLLAAASAAAGLIMAPYFAYVVVERDRLSFVQTQDLVYQSVWENSATDNIPQWKLNGGSALACDIDPVTCGEIDSENLSSSELRDAMISSILQNPIAFVGHRVHYVAFQWFGDETYSYSYTPTNYITGPVTGGSAPNLNAPHGLLYISFLIVAVSAAISMARRGDYSALIVPATALALLAPFAIVHVEVRYLIPLKLLALMTPLLLSQLRRMGTGSSSEHAKSNEGLD